MADLAFCANRGSAEVDITGVTAKGITARCYVYTKSFPVEGVILGEVDFLAGAKSKVDAMIARSRDDAKVKAKKGGEFKRHEKRAALEVGTEKHGDSETGSR